MVTSKKIKGIDRAEKGFTLVEVVMALTLAAMVLVPLLALRNQNINQTHYARQAFRAEFLAHEKLSQNQLEANPVVGETRGDFGSRYPDFHWIQKVAETPLDSVMEVRLKVLWKKGEREEEMEWAQYIRQGSG